MFVWVGMCVGVGACMCVCVGGVSWGGGSSLEECDNRRMLQGCVSRWTVTATCIASQR